MGISLADLGSFAIGAIKEDEKNTAEKLIDRREELQVDRAMHINNKEKKYDRELKAFDEENTKFKAIKSVNAEFIDKGEISPAVYGERYLSVTNPDLLFDYKKEFKDQPNELNKWLAGYGNDAIKHFQTTNTEASLEIDRKKSIDEIQVSYKKKLEDARGDSFLINKLIGEKTKALAKVEEVITDGAAGVTLAKEVNDVPKDDMGFYFGDLTKIDSATQSDLNWKVFKKSDGGKLWMKKFLEEQKTARFNKITFRDNFNEVLTLMDVKKLTNEGNFQTDGYDVQITGMNESTRAIFDTYKDIYNSVWTAIDAKELYMKGVEIQDIAKNVNSHIIKNKIYKITESRIFTQTVKGHTDKDFMGVLPINIVPLNNVNLSYGVVKNIPKYKDGKKVGTINYTAPNKVLTSLYKDFIFAEAAKLKGGDNLVNLNIIQTGVSKGMEYATKFKDYIALNYKEKEQKLMPSISENRTVSIVDNNGEISLNGGVLGTVSLSKLKKEGKLEKVLEKYPWIVKDPGYIAWLESQTQ
tara:strand:- start:1422 stop:2996 length:1575 start_codon:yes stop_codon:yes gene_type:complete